MIYRLGGGYTATVADNDERQELYSDIQRRDKERWISASEWLCAA